MSTHLIVHLERGSLIDGDYDCFPLETAPQEMVHYIFCNYFQSVIACYEMVLAA